MHTSTQLTYCRACLNRSFDPNQGLLCGLTKAKPGFTDSCPSFAIDEPEAIRLRELEKAAQAEEAASGNFAPEQKGIRKGMLGGLAMIAIAVIWFVAGLAADRIFFYPPVLFVIGLYAFIKGILDGNLSGEKHR